MTQLEIFEDIKIGMNWDNCGAKMAKQIVRGQSLGNVSSLALFFHTAAEKV